MYIYVCIYIYIYIYVSLSVSASCVVVHVTLVGLRTNRLGRENAVSCSHCFHQDAVSGCSKEAMGNAGCCSSSDGRPAYEALSTVASSVTGRKKALLVGLNYRNTRAELHGCINDVNNMQQVLVKQYGFKIEDILMLNEDQDKSQWPYKKVILEGMQWLYKDAGSGDLLFFHYSGHGSQYSVDKKAMPADCICPLDCLDKAWPEAVILDTEIHDKLYDPLPKGCKAVCVFDCCHSATVANLCETMVVKEGPLTAAKKEKLVKRLTRQRDDVAAKVRFYREVNSGKLDIKKKSREEMIQLLEKLEYPKRGAYFEDEQANYNYLMGLSISTLFNESVKNAEDLLDARTKALQHVQSLKPGEGAKIYVGNLEQDEQILGIAEVTCNDMSLFGVLSLTSWSVVPVSGPYTFIESMTVEVAWMA